MEERFLHYIWKSQEFDHKNLQTTTGEALSVFGPGKLNENAGPDFLEARIKISEILWAGKVEIHRKSSDWVAHKHETDQKYDNVILHVVWEDDHHIQNSKGETIPTLTLQNRVPEELITKYKDLFPISFQGSHNILTP